VTDFLLELLSEEIPARMQAKASADLARLFEAELAKAGLAAEGIETFVTPRRLVLIARNLPAETEATREETKGPRSSAPPQALEGFLRKTGLTQDQLVERDGVYFAILDRPGRPTSEVLAEAVPAIVRAFTWPKSMRWGAASTSTESLRWVRPLQGIVALLGEQIVEMEIGGIKSGAATVGHRFHHSGPITIGGAGDYVEKLRACHVIVDPAERRRIIAEGAAAGAAFLGAELVGDEALLDENAGLTEWPHPIVGSFDPAFLAVPREVIQLTMRTNQKYFALTDGEGALAPHFICVANIDPGEGAAVIAAGNERVLAARLSDAKFFWEQDLRVPLDEQAKKLSQIVFHEKLGTLADKVERVARLARWLVEEGIVNPRAPAKAGALGDEAQSDPTLLPSQEHDRERLADLAERAARLCKADLVTQVVGEFPELQGIIGGHLARAQGERDEIADAIRDHYKPAGQGDEVPTAPVAVAVSLADKLDTIAAFFGIDQRPTGSKDPFALRRASLGVIQIWLESGVRASLLSMLRRALVGQGTEIQGRIYVFGAADQVLHAQFEREVAAPFRQVEAANPNAIDPGEWPSIPARAVFGGIHSFLVEEIAPAILDFFADRLKVQQREAGVRHDLIDAVFALGEEDDLVRLLARVRALQAFVETPEGADLLAGYKRAANILKKEGWPSSTQPSPISGEGRLAEGERGEGARYERDEEQALTLPPGSAGRVPPSPEMGEGQKANAPLANDIIGEEQALIAALDSAEPRARAAVEAEDFEGAMAALASLRAPVDAFFDKVTVNDPDPAKRAARLDLLARMRDAVHAVADFSKIEG
jgi:glycyl-tRNA synthetase beta chain